jgi:hypothetical protein
MDNEPTSSENVIASFLFAASLAAVIAGVIHGLQGHFTHRGSYNDLVISIGGFAMLFAKYGRVIKVGTTFWAAGATIRVVPYYLHACREVQWLAATLGGVIILIGCAIIVVGAFRWLHEAYSRRSSPEDSRILRL